MAALSRRAALAGLLMLAPLAAQASGGGKGTEFFVKMPNVVLEFWDAEGLFHTVLVELTAVFPVQASLNKKIAQQITHTLSAMPWEEFSRGNPAATIKGVALDIVRKDPTGAACTEVLLVRLVMR